MKGHTKEHHRKHRETGGVNEAEMDLNTKPEARTNAKNIDAEAEERKHGGAAEKKRMRRKHGGEVHHSRCRCEKCMGGRAAHANGGHVHHEKMEKLAHAKHVGKVHGEHATHHAGRKPRKAGGRAGADQQPFSSARHGEDPKGHKTEMEFG